MPINYKISLAKRPVLLLEKDVQARANHYLDALKDIKDKSVIKNLGGISLLPDGVVIDRIEKAFPEDSKGEGWYWRVACVLKLRPSSEEDAIIVQGAGVQIDIASTGNIMRLHSTVLPIMQPKKDEGFEILDLSDLSANNIFREDNNQLQARGGTVNSVQNIILPKLKPLLFKHNASNGTYSPFTTTNEGDKALTRWGIGNIDIKNDDTDPSDFVLSEPDFITMAGILKELMPNLPNQKQILYITLMKLERNPTYIKKLTDKFIDTFNLDLTKSITECLAINEVQLVKELLSAPSEKGNESSYIDYVSLTPVYTPNGKVIDPKIDPIGISCIRLNGLITKSPELELEKILGLLFAYASKGKLADLEGKYVGRFDTTLSDAFDTKLSGLSRSICLYMLRMTSIPISSVSEGLTKTQSTAPGKLKYRSRTVEQNKELEKRELDHLVWSVGFNAAIDIDITQAKRKNIRNVMLSTYKGGLVNYAHFLQFIHRKILLKYGKDENSIDPSRNIYDGGRATAANGSYSLSNDKAIFWHTDGIDGNPFYTSSFERYVRDNFKRYSIVDRPTFGEQTLDMFDMVGNEELQIIEVEAVFKLFLIRDFYPICEVSWSVKWSIERSDKKDLEDALGIPKTKKEREKETKEDKENRKVKETEDGRMYEITNPRLIPIGNGLPEEFKKKLEEEYGKKWSYII